MNLEILNKEKMNALRAVVNINLEVSQARVELSEMQSEIKEFLAKRDIKDKARFDTLLKKSKDIVGDISNNFEQINVFYNEVRSFSVFLGEFHKHTTKMITDFNEDSEKFVELVKREITGLSDMEREIKEQKKYITSEKKNIEESKKEITKEKVLIESRQAQLRTALELIKRKK